MHLPKGHQQVAPYIMISDGPVFIQFLQDTFDAQLGQIINSTDGQKIIHGEIRIGECTLFFADGGPGEEVDCDNDSEAVEQEPKKLEAKEPSNIHIHVYVDDAPAIVARAEKAGGTSVIPIMDDESGQMGGFLDPFSNLWWVKSLK